MKIRLLVLSIVMAAGCHTVANPFVHQKPDPGSVPTDALKTVALAIEQAVEKGDRDAIVADQGGIVVSDEIVRQAIRTRAIRSVLVTQMRASEFACEKRNGMLYILRSAKYKQATSSKDRDRDAGIVMSENNDRWTLYEGIAKSSKLPSRSLSAIEQAFFDARVQCMREGQTYEDASGALVPKGH
ncbi:MAG: DUF1318 domain-containing protein [Candidatus Hydrogenedentes bacterium]|nr:DUF1318 domain-containing protein [Candidatus Hydrogenedentota bacterium]